MRSSLRSSGSVAANQIEADNSLSDKDRLMKFRVCRKEARESGLWLRLAFVGEDVALNDEQTRLDDETDQLVRIYSTIIRRLAASNH